MSMAESPNASKRTPIEILRSPCRVLRVQYFVRLYHLACCVELVIENVLTRKQIHFWRSFRATLTPLTPLSTQ
jgi:hypothetical protein